MPGVPSKRGSIRNKHCCQMATVVVVPTDNNKDRVYIVRKVLVDNEHAEGLLECATDIIINDDADIYTEDGNLIMRFRKTVPKLDNRKKVVG
jgi:hypothetical protein